MALAASTVFYIDKLPIKPLYVKEDDNGKYSVE